MGKKKSVPMMTHRCAQHGCALAEADLDKQNCPTCNNPLVVVSEPETVEATTDEGEGNGDEEASA